MPNVLERLEQRVHVLLTRKADLTREYTRFHELRKQLPEHARIYDWRIGVTEFGLRRKGMKPEEIEALVPKQDQAE